MTKMIVKQRLLRKNAINNIIIRRITTTTTTNTNTNINLEEPNIEKGESSSSVAEVTPPEPVSDNIQKELDEIGVLLHNLELKRTSNVTDSTEFAEEYTSNSVHQEQNIVYATTTQETIPLFTKEYDVNAINDTLNSIEISCNIVGEAMQQTMESKGEILVATEKAELRAESLYNRISAFLTLFPSSRFAKYFSCGVAISFTAFWILKYREVPLSGFFKTTPSMPNVAFNVTMPQMQMPSLPSPADFGIPRMPPIQTPNILQDVVSPTTTFLLGIIITVLIKFRK